MMDCKTALITVLDQIDYTTRACQVNEMIGAVLPRAVISMARDAIKTDTEQLAALLATGNAMAEAVEGTMEYTDFCGADIEKLNKVLDAWEQVQGLPSGSATTEQDRNGQAESNDGR
jgi:hypothetical protein